MGLGVLLPTAHPLTSLKSRLPPPKVAIPPRGLHLLHWMEESLEVKGAAMLASPSFTTGTRSSSKSFSTWLSRSCGRGNAPWCHPRCRSPPGGRPRSHEGSGRGRSPTLCAANCSSLWDRSRCLAPREVGLTAPLPAEGSTGLPSLAAPSRALFFRSGSRSGALASSATPAGRAGGTL